MNGSTLVLAVAVLLTTACASTRMYPMEDGSYLMSANSASDSVAHDAAHEKAVAYCAQMGKRFVMVGKDSRYQGVDKNVKAAVGLAGVLLAPRRNHYGYGGYGMYNGSSHDDYRVDLQFRCL